MAGVPYDQMTGHIWFNGELVPWESANVHVLTHGLHYASSVFEGERAYEGQIFKLQEHTERLFFSANELGMEIPYSVEEINQACIDTLEKQGLTNAYIRPVVWRGSEMMGVSAQDNRINVAIAVWEWPSYFAPEERLKGIRLDRAKWCRPDPKTIPCFAKAAGLYMMLDYRGQVAEATGANVFFIKDGVIHTPTPDCFLNGITRQTVVDLAKARQIEIVERKIMPEEMADFTECFLTGLMEDYDNAVRAHAS